MKIKTLLPGLLLAVACALWASPAHATSPITIDGFVKNAAGRAVDGAVVVAWCGDLSHFGGSSRAGPDGHYIIHTNSDDCPLGSWLTVTTDINFDGFSDGAAHAPTHSLTTVSIILGTYTTVAVPEYGWASAAAATVISGGLLLFVRRRAA